jgi:hypothetical protein
MGVRVTRLRIDRAPLLLLVLLAALLLPAGAALAADGVPLYPPGIDAAYTTCTMTNADLSGPMLAFELRPMEPPAGVRASAAAARRGGYAVYNPIVYGWNAAVGTNWPLGKEVAGWTDDMLQLDPTVADRSGTVYVAWSQRNDPTDDADLWLWKGSEAGMAAPGYPKLLVRGPADTNQVTPDMGVVTLGGGHELWLAWADDRDTGGDTTEIYVLDLSADSDSDGTPDIDEAGFAPASAGLRMDPSGDLVQGQHGPSVGAKGVFWLDDRNAAGSGESEIWRGQPFLNDASAGLFCAIPAGRVKLNVRATAAGAAWLGPGVAGGLFEPWGKNLAKKAHILAFLGDPGEFDASGSAYALTGRHLGTTDLDRDVFFYSPSLRQVVPVCSVGGAGGAYDHTLTQAMPAISTAPGGYRVIWSDARHHYANVAGTPEDSLAYRLYVALVPTVTLKASRQTLSLGKSTALGTRVSPKFGGYTVLFQKGKRHTFSSTYGTHEWFDGWKTLKSRSLSATSGAAFTWSPPGKGTYWIRAWFKGGKKYVDVVSAGRKVPHVPMTSRIVKIVVR